MLRTPTKTGALLSLTMAVCIWLPTSTTSAAVSASTTQIQLAAAQLQAFVNTQTVLLDEPPVIINGRFYVPAKWLADSLKTPLSWDNETKTIQMLTSKAYIQFDPSHDSVTVNGNPAPFHTLAEIRNGRLLVDLQWLALYMNLTYRYEADSQRMELSEVSLPSNAYKESELRKDDFLQNSRPIAKFAFGKSVYRLGEPVDCVDLSYDPDAEGLPDYDWQGKQEAFFKPGMYTVSLTVKDGKGNQSEPFSKTVTILDVPFISSEAFPFYHKPVSSLLGKDQITPIPKQTAANPVLPIVVSQSEDRKLIRGSNAAPIMEKGFLYQQNIKGKARLYPQYVNGTAGLTQFAIIIRNASEMKPVRVTTTAASESQASIYTPLLGNKTVEQFLANTSTESQLTLEPGAARFLTISPELGSGQGFQGIYDLETDGEVVVSYAMISPGDQIYDLGTYRIVQQNDAQNATYPVSEVSWQIDANSLKAPITLSLGDESVEPLLKGVDGVTKLETLNESSAGVRYRIRLVTSGKTAVALYPRGGFFEGAVKVNGSMALLPSTGLTSNEGILLHRTSAGSRVDIELMAAGGTKLPLDLILYPLTDKQ